MNAWNFDIWFVGSGDTDWDKAEHIVSALAERDRRVGDRVGGRWMFGPMMTDLDQKAAIAEVEQLLEEVADGALGILRVRPGTS